MKFNKGLLVVAFASIATNCFGMIVNDAVNNFAVVNPTGGPVRPISAEELTQVLDAMAGDANQFNNRTAVNLRALSAVVRAQLSGQTNLQTLGETQVFVDLFGAGNPDAINALNILVQGDQAQRAAAAAQLKAMLSGAAAAGGPAAAVQTVGGYTVRNQDEATVAQALQPGHPLFEQFNSSVPGVLTGTDLARDMRAVDATGGFDLATAYYFNSLNGQARPEVKEAFNRLAPVVGARQM